MDYNGNVVIGPSYDQAGFFREGLASVMKDGLYGFIDKGNKLIIMLAIFAFMTPAGSYISQQIQQDTANNIHQYFPLMMATVIGIFLHISTTILFESADSHKFNLVKMGVIVLGLVSALLVHH